MENNNGRCAIVIGAGIAGLCAAHVLAEHYEQVTILERDQLRENTYRASVPQSRHVHVLLAKGIQCLEQLFPGISIELAAKGATQYDWGWDGRAFLRGRWLTRFPSGVAGLSSSRITLENIIRERVMDNKRIQLLTRVKVVGLVSNNDATAVCGVKVLQLGATDTLLADLIIDASGRQSKTVTWLQKLGSPAPRETIVNSHTGYASCRMAFPADQKPDWRLMIVFTDPPHSSRSGMIFQEEDGRFIVTLAGAARDYPAVDEDRFYAFAYDLNVEFATAVRQMKRLTPIVGYRRTENRLRHYEEMKKWPRKFMVLGDAAGVFNPVYGQGMTVSLQNALLLAKLLKSKHPCDAHLFQKQIAHNAQAAWRIASSEDFRWINEKNSANTHFTRLMHWYFDRLAQAAPESQYLIRAMLQVQQHLKSSTYLLHPGVWLRILAYYLTILI